MGESDSGLNLPSEKRSKMSLSKPVAAVPVRCSGQSPVALFDFSLSHPLPICQQNLLALLPKYIPGQAASPTPIPEILGRVPPAQNMHFFLLGAPAPILVPQQVCLVLRGQKEPVNTCLGHLPF